MRELGKQGVHANDRGSLMENPDGAGHGRFIMVPIL